MKARGHKGTLLVELLVVVAIIAILAGVYLGAKKRSASGEEKTTPKAAMDKAHDVECMNNLNQLRSLIQMSATENGAFPKALDSRSAINRCPVSNKPYTYDPQTGTVKCTTPGHENF